MKFFPIYFKAAFFFFMSSVSFAKDSIDNDIIMLNPDLSFAITSKYENSDNYYLQILYTERSQSVVLNKIKLTQKAVQYPMAMQPYKEGYRIYVGPIKGSNISYVQKMLRTIGYDEYLVRHIDNKSDYFFSEDILFKKIGRLTGRERAKNNDVQKRPLL